MQKQVESQTVWDVLGGTDGGAPEAFAALVDHFYDGVVGDPILRPMYPGFGDPETGVPDTSDLADERENLALFLIQYFGGPTIYAMKRGHPRLRMRHAPFAIGPAARDAWLSHMDTAIATTPELETVAPILRRYFVDAAHFLQNRDTDPDSHEATAL